MIDQLDMMAVVQKYRGNAVVVPVERASVAWPEVSTYPQRDVSPSVMGKACSFALGVCLAQPDTKVIVFDGDGSLLMNLGTLVTIGNKQPKNLYHFVLENGMYATTGGQPIPGQDTISFTSMARSAGYAAAYDFDNLEDFATQIERVLNEAGPVLICVKTSPNPRLPGQRNQEAGRDRRRAEQTIPELRKDLGVA
jgi:phosphonopyruvate decarboxylase